MLGILVTLLFIPFKLKLIIFGFVLFHGGIFILHLLQAQGFVKELTMLPVSLQNIVDDVAVGVLANVFMHLMVWIVL